MQELKPNAVSSINKNFESRHSAAYVLVFFTVLTEPPKQTPLESTVSSIFLKECYCCSVPNKKSCCC